MLNRDIDQRDSEGTTWFTTLTVKWFQTIAWIDANNYWIIIKIKVVDDKVNHQV